MAHRTSCSIFLCAFAGAAAAPLAAQHCEPSWAKGFHAGGLTLGSPVVLGSTAFEDLRGPALALAGTGPYSGGFFTPFIIAFDGNTFYPLGDGLPASSFWTMTAGAPDVPGFDRLYVAFRENGNTDKLASWTGESWQYQTLTSGSQTPGFKAEAMLVHDDGSGPALFISGTFSQIAGVPAQAIAKWNGQTWSALPGGLHSPRLGRALVSHDDGTGLALYVAGLFEVVGGNLGGISRWDGVSWQMAESMGVPVAMTSHDDGSGAKIYAATSYLILRLDATGFTQIGSAAGGGITTLRSLPTAQGQRLVVTGQFSGVNALGTAGAAQWDGQMWSPLGDGPIRSGWYPTYAGQGSVLTAESFDDGNGPLVYIAGDFHMTGEVGSWNLGRTDGQTWLPIGLGISHGISGGPSSGSQIAALALHDEGAGPKLYAGGSYGFAAGRRAGSLARLEGNDWTGLNADPANAQFKVKAMQSWDDGSGPGGPGGAGLFIATRSTPGTHLARYRNGELTPLPAPGPILALGVQDLGSGKALYAAGGFGLVRWDGAGWSTFDASNTGSLVVHAFTVYDDGAGGGPLLYAGGTAPGTDTRIARWNGVQWESVGGGIQSGSIQTMHVHQEGTTSALYIGGTFSEAGGLPVNNIARWDGAWSAVGEIHSPVNVLASFDDGTGHMLYAGINFRNLPPGVPRGLARWNGTEWEQALGDVLSHSGDIGIGGVLALQPYIDQEARPTLFVGGDFGTAGGVSSLRIAQLVGCAPPACYANCDGSTAEPILNMDDFTCFINQYAAAMALPHSQQVVHYANCDRSNAAPALNVEDFLCFLNAFAQGCR